MTCINGQNKLIDSTSWNVFIHETASLREVMFAFVARIHLATDIKVSDKFTHILFSAFENANFSIQNTPVLLQIFDDTTVLTKNQEVSSENPDPPYNDITLNSGRRNAIYLYKNYKAPLSAEFTDADSFCQIVNKSGSFEKSTPIKLKLEIVDQSFWESVGIKSEAKTVVGGCKWSFGADRLKFNYRTLCDRG